MADARDLKLGVQPETIFSEERILKKMVRVLKILAPISLISLLALAGCTDSNGAAQTSGGSGALERATDNSAVPVVVSKVERSSFPVELRAIGTGQAFKTVSVESQVAGIVKEVHYRQGQLIHQGDLLITLDKSPFLAALAQAEAALARDKAQAQLSQAELQRYSELDKQGIISKQQYEQSLATSTAMQATVQADEAAIQTAKIQLSYCSIYAPISGVAGAQLVYPGATVKANDLPVLVVINQVSPIYVDFAVPQQYLGSIKSFMARSRLGVEATPPGDSVAEKGVLTFVNNTVDTSYRYDSSAGFVSQHRPASLARAVFQCPASAERGAERFGDPVAGRADGTTRRLRVRHETGHDRRGPASESGAKRQQPDPGFAGAFRRRNRGHRRAGAAWFPGPRFISARGSDEAGIS